MKLKSDEKKLRLRVVFSKEYLHPAILDYSFVSYIVPHNFGVPASQFIVHVAPTSEPGFPTGIMRTQYVNRFHGFEGYRIGDNTWEATEFKVYSWRRKEHKIVLEVRAMCPSLI